MVTFLIVVDDDPASIGRVLAVVRQRHLRLDSATITHAPAGDGVHLIARLDLEHSSVGNAIKYLNRIVSVRKVSLVTVDSVLAIVRCTLSPALAFHVMANLDKGARIVHSGKATVTVELSGPRAWVDGFLASIDPRAIKGIARSGPVALDPHPHR